MNRFSSFARNEKGAVPLLILIAVVGVIGVLAVASFAPFRNSILSALYPKNASFAAGIFNENFESGNLNSWDSKIVETNGVIEPSTSAAFEGQYGLHVKTAVNDDVRITKNIPSTSELYTRIRFRRLTDFPPTESSRKIVSNGAASLRFRTQTEYQNRMFLDGGTAGSVDTNFSPEINRWYCLELYTLADPRNGSMKAFVDGQLVASKDNISFASPMNSVWVGSDGLETSSLIEYDIDDIALNDANQIGCGATQAPTGPKRSSGAPSGYINQYTTSTSISMKTEVAASCKYAPTAGVEFAAMTNNLSSSDGLTHVASVSGLSAPNTYQYFVRCKDNQTGQINNDDYKIRFTLAIDDTEVKPIELVANYEAISVYAPFNGDQNANNSASFMYRKQGESNWRNGVPMTVDRRITVLGISGANPFVNQYRASIFGLQPNTSYEVQVVFIDPEGTRNTNPITQMVTTRNDNPPLGTVIETPSTTNLVISQSGTPDNWRSYIPPAGQTSNISGTVTINADYIRIKGFQFNPGIIVIGKSASNIIIEDNTFNIYVHPVIREGGDYTGTSATSENITIQRNSFIKPVDSTAKGTRFVNFVNNTKGGHIIRKNTFKDLSGAPRVAGEYWDCLGGAPNFSITGFVYRDSDINDNYFEGCNDDQVESDGANMNVRIWNNRFTAGANGLQVISVDPTMLGPLYVVRNVSYGNYKANFVKLGSDSTGQINFYHNTHYIPDSTTELKGQGFSYANRGIENIVSRNNIMQVRRYVIELTDGGATHSFDYDNLFTTNADGTVRFAKWDNNSYDTFSKFKALGQEKNGYSYDLVNDRINGFIDPAKYDLRLLSTSTLLDKGKVIDGINSADSPWPYTGSGPDIGAFELAGSAASIAPSSFPAASVIKKLGDIVSPHDKVDIFDYNQLLTDFGKTGSGLVSDIDTSAGSLNKIDIFDYNLLMTNFGK